MKPRLLTPQQIYRRQERAWRAWGQWQVRVVRAFFPDTSGSLHLMHNWYRCAEKTNPEGAHLADWVHDSVWERWHRITHKLEARAERNEHLLNHGDHFRPLWCRSCQPAQSEPGT
jgi:hypothetical protein